VKPFVEMGILIACLPLHALAQMSPDERAIRQVRSESNEAIARHDVPGVLATLEPEYRVSSSSGDFLDGREAMGKAFAGVFARFSDAKYVRTATTVEVSTAGPYAAETGEWVGSWTTPEGPHRTGGRYIAYWRKKGNTWLIHAELYVPLYCDGAACSQRGPGSLKRF
jgi:ketosteroid isomerase-like protein